MSSVLGAVSAVREQMLGGRLTPLEAARAETTLAAVLSFMSDDIQKAEAAYNQKHVELLTFYGTAATAKVYAAATPEHARRNEARAVHGSVVEMIRSLRQLQRTATEEMRLQR